MNETPEHHRRRLLAAAAALLCGIGLSQVGCTTLPRTLAPPRVQVTSLSLLQASAARQRFRVSLLIDNPNPIALPVERLRFALRLAGEGILNGESSTPVNVPALGNETISLDVDTDLVSSLSRLLALVQGPNDALPYELNGRVTLARRIEYTLPFNFSGQVPLSRL